MVNQTQREKFQTLIRGTIISLCQNVLEHKSEVKIDVFVGITLDKTEDFHFSIVETLRTDDVSGSVKVEKSAEAAVSSQSPNGHLRTGSMLEKLMVHDISSNRQGLISSSLLPKGKEVSSTTVSERCQSSSLSYSELLRSFGELSRQDKPCVPSNPSASCPMLLNTLSSSPSSHLLEVTNQNSINQAQVVIPINFAIHSPSTPSSRSSVSVSNKDHEPYDARSGHWGTTSPTSSRMRRYDSQHPDTTYTMPDTHMGKSDSDFNPYNVKVKQEVLSDEELEQEQQSEVDRYRHLNMSLDGMGCLGDGRPSKDGPSQSSSKGILMSLLCEKSPGIQLKKRGRPKKKLDDPLYLPSKQSKSDVSVKSVGAQENKDSRVLIGLTDYLPGFKQGDLDSEKPPRCVFSGDDISAKIRKVVLLNSGPFSTIRMIHRSLQGMRTTEIIQVMQEMTRPRQHAEYVGEYKAIAMSKVRQGRRLIGVFYKCPPELLKQNALEKYDIKLDDYVKFYNQVYKYNRAPQPTYLQCIETFSPFSGTFTSKRGWREDKSLDPTTHLDKVYSAYSITECLTGEEIEMEMSKSEEHLEDVNFRLGGTKSQKYDWESINDFSEDDQNMTAKKGWFKLERGSPTSADGHVNRSTDHLDVSNRNTSQQSAADNYNPNLVTFSQEDFGQQPVFPQPLIVSESHDKEDENGTEQSDEQSPGTNEKQITTSETSD